MKKTITRTIVILLTMICMMLMSCSTFAFCSRTGSFSKNYTLSNDMSRNIYNVAMAQKNKTKKQLGYTEAWCADFVLDCAKLANIPAGIIPYTNKNCCGCGTFISELKNKCGAREISAAEAKQGDLVFYYCTANKSYVHVGICAGGGKFIEGNVSSQVMHYGKSYKDSHGHSVSKGTVRQVYIRPAYPDVSGAKVAVAQTTYNGKARTPSVKVVIGTRTLKKGTDYTVTYSNNVNAGTGTAVITGKGQYYGTRKVGFKISPFSIGKLPLYSKGATYTGKAVTPGIGIIPSGHPLTKNFKNGSAYRLSYSGNVNPGIGKVTVTGVGNYTGTKTFTFRIYPKTPAGLTVKAEKKALSVSWKKVAGATGYEIYYRQKGKSGWSRITTTSTSCKIKNLKSFTNYQVKAAAYTTVGKQTVYSDDTGTRTCRTKLF